ncbi:DUF6114 domain-containing protein [Streptomyces sp. NPDC002779]|uniref:DUF6114 domain-containing protein n=1 Tax=Streptomyces sp. NPDC002779 TaxID=3364664 RepID=UPI0036B1AA0D
MLLTAHPRPWAACLVIALAGVEIGSFPLARPSLLGMQGFSGASAVLVAAALLGCSVLLWMRPANAALNGTAAIFLGLLSYPLANLGGFLFGMLLALLGGALALAWQPVDEKAVSVPARD